MSKAKLTFREYYQHYLELHQHPRCRLFHFVGQCMTILFVFSIFYTSYWYLVFLIPFVVYPFAWFGHFYYEKNKPAAFSNPFYAKLSDWFMFKDILLGKLRIW